MVDEEDEVIALNEGIDSEVYKEDREDQNE